MPPLTPFNITLAILWFIATVIDYAGYLYYWQLKWYRWDRFKDFLHSRQGQNFIFRKSFIMKSLFAIIIFFWPLNEILVIKQLIFVFFILDIIYLLGYKRSKKILKRPVMSAKATVILITAIIFEAFLVLYIRDWHGVLLLILLRLFTLGIIVRLIDLTTGLIKKYYFIKAKKKLVHYANLKVIGITGSYGKTTVKEMLYQMLSPKYKVIKTPRNINSDIGISKFILESDFTDTTIFIVEIGAYNNGDVALICDIVHPTIGVLTAINEQHLSLFGSIQNIQSTKYELLRALPKDGSAITNSDNPYCREYLDEIDAEVLTFGTEKEYHPTLLIEDIQTKPAGIYCKGTVHLEDEDVTREIQTQLQGEHNVYNLSACILVAMKCGMLRDEIVNRAEKLKNPERSLRVYDYGDTTIIDDSYNSNPDGFKAALQLLTKYPTNRKRIVITRGMLELGEKSDELHEKIGGEISFVADELIIITPDFIEPLRRGIVEKYRTMIHIKTDVNDLLMYMKSLKETDAVILIENRIPTAIKKEINQK